VTVAATLKSKQPVGADGSHFFYLSSPTIGFDLYWDPTTAHVCQDVLLAAVEVEGQRWLACDARGYSFVAKIVCDVVARDMLTNGETRRIKTRLNSR